MTLNSSGNVGIGTVTTSNVRLTSIAATASWAGTFYANSGGASTTGLNEYGLSFGGNYSNGSAEVNIVYGSAGAGLDFSSYNGTTVTPRMRIDSAGQVAIGKTAASESYTSGSGFGFAAPSVNPFFSVVNLATSSNNACVYLNQRNTTGTNSLIVFLTNNGSSQGSVGSITHNGTNTTYGTSSDYRLKENVALMTGALKTIAALKPVTYTWKANGSAGQGFIAHELQEVVPDAVSGEKDALDKDGSIKPQNVDTSYLVATLVSAIQEQQALITQLQADVATLKGAA
jgi:hypothetical protein